MHRASPDQLLAAARRVLLQEPEASGAPRKSKAIYKIGYDPDHCMVVVKFTSSGLTYGYPHLDDDEIRGPLAVWENHESLGHYISTVIKPNHDRERVQF